MPSAKWRPFCLGLKYGNRGNNDTWLIKYTPRLPDNLGCFVFNVNFLIVDYFYLRIRYLMKITLFDDFDMWQNVDVQVLIERI